MELKNLPQLGECDHNVQTDIRENQETRHSNVHDREQWWQSVTYPDRPGDSER